MMKLLIKNGRVIDPDSGQDGVLDLLIEDGRIVALDRAIEVTDAKVRDASGLIVAPGFLDIHVHLREPGIEHAETIESGTGKGDWPKPNLYIFFPLFFNLLDSSLIAKVADGLS